MSNLVVPRREIGGDALHRTERQVLDLWDQGVGFRGIAADGSQLYITIHAGRDGGLAMRLSGDQIDRFCHLLATAVFAINRASVLGGQGGEALQ